MAAHRVLLVTAHAMARAGLRVREVPVRLIYNDPNRHFGGDLDDAEKRLRHYLEVLHRELERPLPGSSNNEPAAAGAASCCCCEK